MVAKPVTSKSSTKTVKKALKAPVKVKSDAPVVRRAKASDLKKELKPRKDGACIGRAELNLALVKATGCTPADCKKFMDTLCDVVQAEVKSNGDCMIPGFCRVMSKTLPALPERQGINPFTKEEITLKARPETIRVRARAVGALKKAVM